MSMEKSAKTVRKHHLVIWGESFPIILLHFFAITNLGIAPEETVQRKTRRNWLVKSEPLHNPGWNCDEPRTIRWNSRIKFQWHKGVFFNFPFNMIPKNIVSQTHYCIYTIKLYQLQQGQAFVDMNAMSRAAPLFDWRHMTELENKRAAGKWRSFSKRVYVQAQILVFKRVLLFM